MNVYDFEYKLIFDSNKANNIFYLLILLLLIIVIMVLNIKIENKKYFMINIENNIGNIVVPNKDMNEILSGTLYYKDEQIKYNIITINSSEDYDLVTIKLLVDYKLEGDINIYFKLKDIKFIDYIIKTMKGWYM